ncbi:DUF6973 domain-containing protein [Polaribacter sp. SA4-12]|uniref:DUF6973 domain-containing protein n=1 Tax=Polaribacter sp. SA4-12 TaxID=1312072 RepID=UPI000B3D1459|nr:hypothetical protein [Polaribacter sp. SA4-12]ARV14744.1 hypothetical protein BTO07_06090 [Polaribacter sp. SA4-12]
MIQYDFPELSQTEIEDQIDLIDEYYARALNNTIVNHMEGVLDLDDFVYYNPPNNNPPVIPTHNSENLPNEEKKDCILRLGDINWIDFKQLYSMYFADKGATNSSRSKYDHLDPNNTKRDDYRHTVWNALLSRYYWTTSSKLKKFNFAKKIADLNERCATNEVGTLYMDYHNNEVGRQLYQDKTTFKKFLWMKTGLNEPSANELKDFAYDLIEDHAVFIDMNNLFPTQGITEPQELAYLKIIRADKTKPVYLSEEINKNPYYGN